MSQTGANHRAFNKNKIDALKIYLFNFETSTGCPVTI